MGANQHTSEGRTVSYPIRFTADEKRALEARADAAGVSLAELIRAALGLAKAATAHVDPPLPEACARGECAHFRHRGKPLARK